MLSPQQESNLTSGGDSVDHWHSADRLLTHDDVLSLQQLAKIQPVTTDITVDDRWDYLLVDSSSGNRTVTLPLASNGREIEVIKAVAANKVTILPTGADTIIGATGVIIQSRYDALRLKAVAGQGWVAI